MTPIRVLLADDHTVLRDSLRAFLTMYSDIEVVGEAADGLETLAQVQALRPDVVLLDMAMPNLGGLEVLRRIGKEWPQCKVLVLTQHEAPQVVLPALQAGAQGYLLKKASGSEVVQAVRSLARGESFLHPAIARLVIEAAVRARARGPGPDCGRQDQRRNCPGAPHQPKDSRQAPRQPDGKAEHPHPVWADPLCIGKCRTRWHLVLRLEKVEFYHPSLAAFSPFPFSPWPGILQRQGRR